MGLRRLQQVLELPRDGLAKRFPPQLLAHLDQLQGHHPLALSCYQPPDYFRQRRATHSKRLNLPFALSLRFSSEKTLLLLTNMVSILIECKLRNYNF